MRNRTGAGTGTGTGVPSRADLGVPDDRLRPGRPTGASAASAASPCPYTHSGSGPSSGSPVKNFAAMHPPRHASNEPHEAQAPALWGSRSDANNADSRHTAGNPPVSRTLPARNSAVDDERAGVDVADGVDEADDPARAAQVEPVERLAQGRQVEERVAREHAGVLEQPVVEVRCCAAVGCSSSHESTARPDGRSRVSAELGAVRVGDGRQRVELLHVLRA